MGRADASYSNCTGKRTDITSPGRSGGDCTACMCPCVFWWDHNTSGGFLSTCTHTCYESRSFNNAVLTDITEGLFSAVKHWVFGQGSQSPTLFMAVVRITRGCLELYRKPFLTDYLKVMKRVIKGNKEKTVRCVHPPPRRCRVTHVLTTVTHSHRTVFQTLGKKLTSWAVIRMLNTYSKNHTAYDVTLDYHDNNIYRVIKNKSTKDRFFVNEGFECRVDPNAISCCWKPCWQQKYSGMLCIHSLMVLVDRVSRTESLKDIHDICYQAIQACNSHWWRATYSTHENRIVELPDPKHLTNEVIVERNQLTRVDADVTDVLKERFAAVVSLMSREWVNKHLCEMETNVLETFKMQFASGLRERRCEKETAPQTRSVDQVLARNITPLNACTSLDMSARHDGGRHRTSQSSSVSLCAPVASRKDVTTFPSPSFTTMSPDSMCKCVCVGGGRVAFVLDQFIMKVCA